MRNESIQDMTFACHQLAEYILRCPMRGNRADWLKRQVKEMLTNKEHVLYYAQKYSDEYPYADVRNEYLANVLKSYDEEVA